MLSLFIYQKDGMKDLHGLMRIHCWANLGDDIKVAINKLTQPAIVIHGSCSGSSTDIELKIRNTERILDIDQ